ncbi:Retrovirus-related Pol polyprotein from transposon opus [Vitis vinifera]|uniref:Retrovirus-related Pol polyprotein from transposon opus n=1 Tax=Vitis vinifera TaxID=29760 RepID=A0A438HXG9_VITVI|nr:Retrovirus-related Pol polyprotein from transposon opus [Vitis vinifera]
MKNSCQREPWLKRAITKKRRVGRKCIKSSIEEEPRIVIKEDMMKKHMPPPFPQALHGKKEIKNSSEILEVLRQVKSKSPVKYKDPGCPTISVNIGGTHVEKALLDLGASVNLLPYSVYKQLGLGGLKPTTITLSLADSHHVSLEEREEILPCSIRRTHKEQLGGPSKAVLKPLPVDLKYAYLEEDEKCPVVVSSTLTRISPLVCTHHIYMEEDAKPVRQPQRRLNPHMQEVVRGEVLKLLQAGIIYPISDSLWVSPTQVVPKKSGITVIQNEKGEEVSTRLPQDGGRMPFGLCNAPATFQRCMLSIFSDMVERIMEVFMDDITVYGVLMRRSNEKKSFEELKQFLTTAPIVRAPNWKLPFEVMCDASDLAMGAVLGQREDGKPYVIYYASKTLNEAQRNYTTTEKELLAVVFALDKFRAYLVGSSIVVFTDHSCFEVLANQARCQGKIDKMDPFAQEFNLQIRDKKGVENVVADHLSRLVIAHDSHGLPINDDFPEESLMSIEVAPWYSHIANYLVTGEVPSEWSAQDKRHFFAKIHAYYWEEPFLFKYCADQIIRKCVPEQEQSGILPIVMIVHVEVILLPRKQL